MKTLTLVSAGLELPDHSALLRREASDEYPRASLFYQGLNSDRLDELFLERTPKCRRLLYKGLPTIAAQLVEASSIKHKYDAVISWTERLGLMFACALRLAGGNTPHIGIFSWISPKKKALLFRQLHPQFDRIILMSSLQRRIAIESLNIPPSKIALLKWGVDQNFWKPMNTHSDLICSAGSERRDYQTLIEAMQGLNIPCHIAAGTQRNVIHSSVKAIGNNSSLPPLVTMGKRGYADLRMLYARSRFVVIPILPSDTDHGTTTILEAMAMGKAVICSRTDGQVDVVQEGKTGIFVRANDPRALRSAIQYLWDNPDVAEQMGREGRKYIEKHHTIDAFVNSIKTVVSDVIQQKKLLPAGNTGSGSVKSMRENENNPVAAGEKTIS